jgi:hypothetical protein
MSGGGAACAATLAAARNTAANASESTQIRCGRSLITQSPFHENSLIVENNERLFLVPGFEKRR